MTKKKTKNHNDISLQTIIIEWLLKKTMSSAPPLELLLMGIQSGTSTLEKSLAVPHKV